MPRERGIKPVPKSEFLLTALSPIPKSPLLLPASHRQLAPTLSRQLVDFQLLNFNTRYAARLLRSALACELFGDITPCFRTRHLALAAS